MRTKKHVFFGFVLIAAVLAAGTAVTASGVVHSAGSSSTALFSTAVTGDPFDGNNWFSTDGNLANERYSTLTQVNTSNVSKLQLAWSARIDPYVFQGEEVSPTVDGNTLFTATGHGSVAAYNATTGQQLWFADPGKLNGGASSSSSSLRGVGVGDGLVFFANEYVGSIVAYNYLTGALVWQTVLPSPQNKVLKPTTPVFYDGEVFTSSTGSDGGLFGQQFALNAKTGAVLWTFNADPTVGTAAYATWGNPAQISTGGGGSWGSPAVDPSLGLVYFTTANAYPYGGRAAGNDEWTSSIIALNAKTGTFEWGFQGVHHDMWDYDCTTPPIIFNDQVNGATVPAVEFNCKPAILFTLNAKTGKPIIPVTETQTWSVTHDPIALAQSNGSATQPISAGDSSDINGNSGIIPHCPPWLVTDLPNPAPNGQPYEYGCTFAAIGQNQYTAYEPGIDGGMNFMPSSYNAKLGYVFTCAIVSPYSFIESPTGSYTTGATFMPAQTAHPNLNHVIEGTFTAVNVRTNNIVWQHDDFGDTGGPCYGGSATTAGGVTFTSQQYQQFQAYDAATGKLLWQYTPSQPIAAAPIVYGEGGKEYVAIETGGSTIFGTVGTQDQLLVFTLPST
jgi:alcohol dehydrogenase (cytochrome c)